jgi:hypothetical protein
MTLGEASLGVRNGVSPRVPCPKETRQAALLPEEVAASPHALRACGGEAVTLFLLLLLRQGRRDGERQLELFVLTLLGLPLSRPPPCWLPLRRLQRAQP